MNNHLPLYRHAIIAIALLLVSNCLLAKDIQNYFPVVQKFFPSAERVGALEGTPASAPVFAGEDILGYVFYTDDITPMPAYSGKPISSLVGFDTQGTIRGVKILSHEEPILAVGIKDSDLQAYVSQYNGVTMSQRTKIGGRDREGYKALDGISGATITVIVINASVTQSLHKVIKARNIQAVSQTSSNAALVAAIDAMPIWFGIWEDRKFEISLLVFSLLVLTGIMVFQDWLARHPFLLTRVRNFYLSFTLLFVGWYMLGQLSVINVLTFFTELTHQFSWDTFLVDPTTFVLWGFVAITIILWGRGVYCGWMCPFGALQELLNKLAVRLKLHQFELPMVVHERLLAVKYIVFIVLFGLSLQSLALVLPFIEIEPFKTVITLRFDREWPYLTYAIALLVIGLFNRKFYCKYLCPLGAALAIPSRLKLFDWWLRRRKECGHPCQACAKECEVQAIRHTGEIDANECHYCLDCQVTYWNNHKCPPLVEKRKRRERRQQRVAL
ncbi:MAG: 4Fe-4S binding protein [Sulfuriflexus sp.]|nr:4Fe-4S binding protein [Sulfuriflexus sp.]